MQSLELRTASQKVRRQGAQTLRNGAYCYVRQKVEGRSATQHPDFLRSRLSLSQSPRVHTRHDHIKETLDVKERIPASYRFSGNEFSAAA
jgi:hypothetical protein